MRITHGGISEIHIQQHATKPYFMMLSWRPRGERAQVWSICRSDVTTSTIVYDCCSQHDHRLSRGGQHESRGRQPCQWRTT